MKVADYFFLFTCIDVDPNPEGITDPLAGYVPNGLPITMEEDGVRYFIQYFQGEHKNEYTIRTTTGTVLLYANSVLKMRWHEGKDGKPFDQIAVYKRGKVDYFQDASCMIDNEKVKRIVNHKQGNRLEITSLKSGKLIYHGKYNELYQENDWGIQFDEASGKLVAEGIWENGKLTEITRCFDGDTMTELDRNGEDSLDPVKQIPIYVGGFYYDEDCETFYRNDEGCLIDGRTGIAYHEGLWNKGNEIHGRDLHDGWYTLPLNGDVLPNIIPVTEHTEVADSKSDNNNNNNSNKKENQPTSFVIYDMRELNWIEQRVTELFIASDCCNDAYSLKLSGFRNLKSLEIGDNSFSVARLFQIDRVPNLRSIKIGNSSFTQERKDGGRDYDKSFHIVNCGSLQSIDIGRYSFSDFAGQFELYNLPVLRSIRIGDLESESYNFFWCTAVIQGIDFF